MVDRTSRCRRDRAGASLSCDPKSGVTRTNGDSRLVAPRQVDSLIAKVSVRSWAQPRALPSHERTLAMKKHLFAVSLYLPVTIASLVAIGCGAGADTESEGKTKEGVERHSSNAPGATSALGGPGALCGGGTYPACQDGLYCIGTPGGPGFCQAPAKDGQICGGGSHPPCENGLYCIGAPGSPGFCRAPAREGQICEGSSHPPCAAELYCVGPAGGDGICRAPAQLGQLCGGTSHPPCARGLWCDDPLGGGGFCKRL
jgi:hypothetical protein